MTSDTGCIVLVEMSPTLAQVDEKRRGYAKVEDIGRALLGGRGST